jgi:hypothetical protein
MTRLILPVLALALMTSGLFICMRNRSPYRGVKPDAASAKPRRIGEVLILLGMLGHAVNLYLRR